MKIFSQKKETFYQYIEKQIAAISKSESVSPNMIILSKTSMKKFKEDKKIRTGLATMFNLIDHIPESILKIMESGAASYKGTVNIGKYTLHIMYCDKQYITKKKKTIICNSFTQKYI